GLWCSRSRRRSGRRSRSSATRPACSSPPFCRTEARIARSPFASPISASAPILFRSATWQKSAGRASSWATAASIPARSRTACASSGRPRNRICDADASPPAPDKLPSVPTWKLTLEYDGTRYRGWQTQKNTDRTVQAVLQHAAGEIFGEEVAVGGSGRTDAGVHALAQVAHLKARKDLPPREIREGLNDRLPFDVNVLSVEKAEPRFHARHDAKARTYLYRISGGRPAFDKRLVWWVKARLDVAAMRRVARLFEGRHDFASFCENPGGRESTIVVVEKSEVLDVVEEIHFRITAC